MLGALITGVLLAAGHHLFYESLHGTPAPTLTASYRILGAKISRQETNTAVGTAFAFLVKASLAFAISIAFVQVFWRTARRPDTKNGPTLASLDLIYSALDNIFVFIYVSTWWKYPVLLLIALAAW